MSETLIDVNEMVDLVELEYQRTKETTLKRVERERDEKLAAIKSNAAVLPELQKLDVKLTVPAWSLGARVYIDLGEKPRTRAAKRLFDQKVVAIRKLLGNLKMVGRSVYCAEKKLVTVELKADAYPGIWIQFEQKLRRGGPCKLTRVKRTSSYVELVCEVPTGVSK